MCDGDSSLPKPSLTSLAPHYLNHHSPPHTSTITHSTSTVAHNIKPMGPWKIVDTSTLPQPSLTVQLHTTSTITHRHITSTITDLHTTSTSLTLQSPHYLNHHSRSTLHQPRLTTITHLHTTSTITHTRFSTIPQPSATIPHYPNHHSPISLSTLPQPSLTWLK